MAKAKATKSKTKQAADVVAPTVYPLSVIGGAPDIDDAMGTPCKLTESSMRATVNRLDFTRPDVVQEAARVLGIILDEQPGGWVATPPASPSTKGERFEYIAMFVRGYACSWTASRASAKRMLEGHARTLLTEAGAL